MKFRPDTVIPAYTMKRRLDTHRSAEHYVITQFYYNHSNTMDFRLSRYGFNPLRIYTDRDLEYCHLGDRFAIKAILDEWTLPFSNKRKSFRHLIRYVKEDIIAFQYQV